jgi:hypothetical protein
MKPFRVLYGGALVLASACGGQIEGTGPGSDGGGNASDAGAAGNDSAVSTEASMQESAPASQGFTQLYFMACVSQLTDGTIATPTLFTATATFTPSASGSGGSLDFSDAVLQYSATSLSQTVAATVSEMGVPVAADGTAVINYGPTTIPPAGNPLQNGEVDFSALILTFQIGPGTDLCANVTGAYSAPVSEQITVVGQNVCIYVPMANMTDPLPTLTQSQVHCP